MDSWGLTFAQMEGVEDAAGDAMSMAVDSRPGWQAAVAGSAPLLKRLRYLEVRLPKVLSCGACHR